MKKSPIEMKSDSVSAVKLQNDLSYIKEYSLVGPTLIFFLHNLA